jgi:iron(III) transport system permease protein
MTAAAAEATGRLHPAGRRRPPQLLLVLTVAVAALVLLPVGETLFQAAHVGSNEAAELLFRPLVGELLVNTIGLTAATTLVCGVIGTGCAWLTERTNLPGRQAWAVLAVVPLAIPPFISSYGWISFSPALEGFAGALLVVSCAYYPLIYLPVAAALRGMDPALEESARTLGRGPWACFFGVVLPQLRPALLGGMLLVGLHMLGEFGAFALLRFRTFTTELYAEYRTGFNGPGASLLAVVLLVLCLVCLIAELRVRSAVPYARVGRGALRRTPPLALGWMTLPLLAALAVLTAATIGVPLGMILYWLTQHGAAAITPAEVSSVRLLNAALASIWLGLTGAVFTVLLALPLAFLAARHQGWVTTLLERAAYLTQGVPAIVVALALITLTLQAAPPLYQTAGSLIFAYAILFLPLALVSIRAALMQAQKALEEVGRSLGLGWFAVVWRVILPLAASGLGAAVVLVFVSVVTELTATLLLAPIGTRTLATEIWADTSTLAYAAAAPYAALMAALSLVSTWLLARRYGSAALVAMG